MGHHDVAEKVADHKLQVLGKRHHLRLMSDAYGEGIVRGQVENMNLRAYHQSSRVTAAEAIITCRTTRFAGVEYVNMVQRLSDHVLPDNETVIAEVDTRHRKFRKITLRDTAVLYGQRPRVCLDGSITPVWYLSPYEFVKDWEITMVSYPKNLKNANDARHHVRLTEEGKEKLKTLKEALKITAWMDAKNSKALLSKSESNTKSSKNIPEVKINKNKAVVIV